MLEFALFALMLPQITQASAAPIELHRRAVDYLEAQRDRDGSVWSDAHLGMTQVSLHAPGIDGPTHYEFAVYDRDDQPRGFIIVSAMRDDFPVAHARDAGPSPSAMLQDEARGEIETIYRFGHGNYVAEDASHGVVAEIGTWPAKVSGYPVAALSLSDEARRGYFRSVPGTPDEEHHPDVAPELKWGDWSSWKELRQGYAAQRELLAPANRRGAEDDWRTEDLLRGSGATLQSGEFRERPLLSRGTATWTVEGAGREFVHVELGERSLEGDAALRIFVDKGPAKRVLPVDINVDYSDGSHEVLRLNVTDRIPGNVLASPAAMGAGVFGRWSQRARQALPNCSKAVIKTSLGPYLRGDPSGGTAITAKGAYRDAHTFFRIEDRGDGKIRLKAPNGRYVHVPPGGGTATASVVTPGADETFRLYADDRHPGRFGLRSNRGYRVWPFNSGAVATNGERSPPVPVYEFEYCQPRNTFARWAGKNFANAWKKVRRYHQIPAHTGPSTSQCSSGCAATAWAMVFGFHDYEAHRGLKRWAHLKAFYLRNNDPRGHDAVAPARLFAGTGNRSVFNRADFSMNAGAASMIWEISQDMNDWVQAGCGPGGQKWTTPLIMGKAKQFLDRRLTVGLVHDYDGLYIMTAAGKKNAYAVIKDKKPVVLGIGSGDSLHYPMGIGRDNTDYRVWDRGRQRWAPEANHRSFIVHMGHQQVHTDIVPYGTWFSGHVIPTKAPPKTHQAKPGVKPNPRKKPMPGVTPIKLPPPNTGTAKPGVNPNPQKKPMPGPKPGKLPTPPPKKGTAKPGVKPKPAPKKQPGSPFNKPF